MRPKIFVSIIIIFLLVVSTEGAFAQTETPSQIKSGSPKPTKSIEVPDEVPPSGVNMTLSPSFLNLTSDPGKEVVSQFKVTNNNAFREYIEIDVKKFESSDTGPVIQDTTEQDEFARWVEFSEAQFTIEPNQTKTIKFTITPPSNAALGYYYAIALTRMKPGGQDGTGASITGSPALPVLLLVNSPNAKKEVQVLDFSTDKVFYEYLPMDFVIKVKNTGNIHTAPGGDIFIDSMFKKEVVVLPANKGRGNILPQSTRDFIVPWDDGMIVRAPKVENGEVVRQDGEIVYETKLDLDKPLSTFRIGKYTAHLIMIYDNGERDVPIEASVSFWIIPWRILGSVLLILLAPVMLFYTISKIRGRRKNK